MEKIVTLELVISLTPKVDMTKLKEYSPALAEEVPATFKVNAQETAMGPACAESNVTLVMTDALIKRHKATVERVGDEALVDNVKDVIIPAIKEAFTQACDMAIRDMIYADPDAEPEMFYDYRKDDTTTLEGEYV